MPNSISIDKATEGGDSELLYFQSNGESENSRKVIDLLLDSPEGDTHTISVTTGARSLSFTTGDLDISTIVKAYNGIRSRKPNA